MSKRNIVKPTGLKGTEKLSRMKQLMGVTPINESVNRSVIELTKNGPDGNIYAIVRENQEYYIKSCKNKKNVISEDFKYIGGLQNKKSKSYPSYAKAIKHLNLKFISLNEAHSKSGNINTFKNDNILDEHHAIAPNKAFSETKPMDKNISKEYIVNKKGSKLSYDNKKGKEKDGFGDNVADKDAIDELEDVKLNETENFIDKFLVENTTKEILTVGKLNNYITEMIDDDEYDPISYAKQSGEREQIENLHNNEELIAAAIEEVGGKDIWDTLSSEEKEIVFFDVQHSGIDEPPFDDDKEIEADWMQNYQKDEFEGMGPLDESIVERLSGILKKKRLTEYTKPQRTGLFREEEDGYNDLDEETSYKIKLDAPSSEPDFDASDEEEDFSLDSLEDSDEGSDNDKPFDDDEPFDPGVEADEEEDPEKFIQQLAGKIGTSLRTYTKDNGEPDFDLEKYVINSVISATHTAEMDKSDQKDIIEKIKTSGDEDEDEDLGDDEFDDDLGGDDEDLGGEEDEDLGDDEDGDTEENLEEQVFFENELGVERSGALDTLISETGLDYDAVKDILLRVDDKDMFIEYVLMQAEHQGLEWNYRWDVHVSDLFDKHHNVYESFQAKNLEEMFNMGNVFKHIHLKKKLK